MNNLSRGEDELTSKLKNLLDITEQTGGDFLSRSSPEIMEVAVEYTRLAVLQHRSEDENNCLEKILKAANDSEILNFWIVEVDHIIAHHLGLLDEDDRESYRDQQALLVEYGGLVCELTTQCGSAEGKIFLPAIVSSYFKEVSSHYSPDR